MDGISPLAPLRRSLQFADYRLLGFPFKFAVDGQIRPRKGAEVGIIFFVAMIPLLSSVFISIFPMVGGLEFAAIMELIPFGTIDTITTLLMTLPFYIEGTMFLFLGKNIPGRLTNFLELYTGKLSSLILPGKLQTMRIQRW